MDPKTLIDAAVRAGYTRARIAQELGIRQSFLSMVERGTKQMPPELAALLADLAGQDAAEALKRQTVANERDERRRSLLERALFLSLAVGVAAGLVTTDASAQDLTDYTLWQLLGAFLLRRNRALGLRPRAPAGLGPSGCDPWPGGRRAAHGLTA